MAISLTQAATAATQSLGVLDSGEGLSASQLADALAAANNILANWYQEQNLSLQILVSELARAGAVFIDNQSREMFPLVTAFTLSAGTFTPPSFVAGFYIPASIPQFADSTTPLTLPGGYDRALKLALAIELAPQYDTQAGPDLLRQAAEARAAASPVPRNTPVPGTSGTRMVQPVPDAPAPQSVGG